MTEDKRRSRGSQAKPAPTTLRDVLIILVGIGAFFGLLVQIIGIAPSILPLACAQLALWFAAGTWLLYDGTRRHSCLLRLLGGLSLTVLLFGCCVLPAMGPRRSTARRSQCFFNMRRIALALQHYSDKYGCFPPAYAADGQGHPMHSWRVLLLPFLDEKELYEEYDVREPWDGANNSRLAARMPDCYMCPSSPSGPAPPLTVYVAVVGPGTVWPGIASTPRNAVVDGANSTILVVESSAVPVHWMEPKDLDVQRLPLEINSRAGKGISSRHPLSGAHVAFVDGSVAFLSEKTCTRQQLRALLTIAGGEQIESPRDD